MEIADDWRPFLRIAARQGAKSIAALAWLGCEVLWTKCQVQDPTAGAARMVNRGARLLESVPRSILGRWAAPILTEHRGYSHALALLARTAAPKSLAEDFAALMPDSLLA